MEAVGLLSKLDAVANELQRIGNQLERIADNMGTSVSATLETTDESVLRVLDPGTNTEKVIAPEVDGKENIFRITLIGVNTLGPGDEQLLQRLRNYVLQQGWQQNYTENTVYGVGMVPKLSHITVTGSWLMEHEVDEGFFYIIEDYKFYTGNEMTFLGRRDITRC